jgi:hypothetical protein
MRTRRSLDLRAPFCANKALASHHENPTLTSVNALEEPIHPR